jgi:hypothetical protein
MPILKCMHLEWSKDLGYDRSQFKCRVCVHESFTAMQSVKAYLRRGTAREFLGYYKDANEGQSHLPPTSFFLCSHRQILSLAFCLEWLFPSVQVLIHLQGLKIMWIVSSAFHHEDTWDQEKEAPILFCSLSAHLHKPARGLHQELSLMRVISVTQTSTGCCCYLFQSREKVPLFPKDITSLQVSGHTESHYWGDPSPLSPNFYHYIGTWWVCPLLSFLQGMQLQTSTIWWKISIFPCLIEITVCVCRF